MEVFDEMKDENININIENIYVDNLIISNDSLEFLKGNGIKVSNKKNKKESKDLDISKKINHNIEGEVRIDEENNGFPYVPPKRLNTKRNFGNNIPGGNNG